MRAFRSNQADLISVAHDISRMLSWIGIRAAKSCRRINAQHAPGSVTEGIWLVRQRNSRSSTLLIRVMAGGGGSGVLETLNDEGHQTKRTGQGD